MTQSGPRAHLNAFWKAALLDYRNTLMREGRSIVA